MTIVERVRQLGNPAGATGLAISDYMNAINGPLNAAAFRVLMLRPNDRVIEIGF